jgi:hypothetical protein
MGDYTNDLMMAVVVASTAFIGLTPILFKQIAESGLGRVSKILLLSSLTISIPLGIGAVVLAVGWLEVQGEPRLIQSQKLFTWQIFTCSVVAIIFMSYHVCKIGRSNPVARSSRSQK